MADAFDAMADTVDEEDLDPEDVRVRRGARAANAARHPADERGVDPGRRGRSRCRIDGIAPRGGAPDVAARGGPRDDRAGRCARFSLRLAPVDLGHEARTVEDGFRDRFAAGGIEPVGDRGRRGRWRRRSPPSDRFEPALERVEVHPSGGRVTMSVVGRDDTAILEVRDTGPGIPPEEIGRVFDRFYRGPSVRAGVRDRPRGRSGSGASPRRRGVGRERARRREPLPRRLSTRIGIGGVLHRSFTSGKREWVLKEEMNDDDEDTVVRGDRGGRGQPCVVSGVRGRGCR